MKIRLGNEGDIEGWMRLVEKVKRDFPGLETEKALAEHRNTVLDFMRRGSAVCAEEEGKIIGALLFSARDGALCFLAVEPQERRRHIAGRMVEYMLTFMGPGKDVVVTTYREGAPEGIAARAFYKRMGFVEGKLTEEFGSPVQELVLPRQTGTGAMKP